MLNTRVKVKRWRCWCVKLDQREPDKSINSLRAAALGYSCSGGLGWRGATGQPTTHAETSTKLSLQGKYRLAGLPDALPGVTCACRKLHLWCKYWQAVGKDEQEGFGAQMVSLSLSLCLTLQGHAAADHICSPCTISSDTRTRPPCSHAEQED